MKLAKNHSTEFSLVFRPILMVLVIGFLIISGQKTAVSVQAISPQQDGDLPQLAARAEENGTVRVLVQLNLPFRPEGDLEEIEGVQSVQSQQANIDGLQETVLAQLADTNTAVIATYKYIPYMALELDAAGLEALASLPQVVSIEEDIPVPPALSSSVPVIAADQVWGSGYTGEGQTIAILDTGIDTDHAAFTTGGNRIVSEGCYSTTNASYGSTTVCPDGNAESTAVGSGVDCTAAAGPSNTKAQSDCSHGTHVASIAAGDNGGSVVGVAPGANIISLQVFSLFNSVTSCGGYSNCVLTFSSDQILALERVYELRTTFNIASVNMSLGSGQNNIACDGDGRKAAIDNLRAAGIATIIASGNNGYRDNLSAPSCISSAISVGATDNADNVASFSNVSPYLSLLAPGLNIYAAVPNGYGTKSGTSMATPHVTGAWALFKQAVPTASVDEALAAFQAGAVLVDDNRSGGIETDLARINVNAAINAYVTGLSVDLSASADYLLPGDTVNMQIDVTNDTGDAASQVSLSLPVPDALTVNMGSLSGGATVANGTITWATGQTLNPGQSLSRSVTFAVKGTATAGEVSLTATAVSPTIDEARQGTAVLTINEVVDCGFSDGFEAGSLGSAWETAVTEEGRVQVLSALPNSGSYSVVLDDSVAGAAKSEAALILTADLTNQAEVALNFSWFDLGDEYDADYDGLFVREQPDTAWVKVYDFAGSYHDGFQNAQVDLKAVASENGLELTDRFQIKFDFYDNFSFNADAVSSGDGYAVDDVSFTCVPKGLAVTQVVDNLNPKPGDAVNFQIVVTNNQPITATNAVISFVMADGLLVNGAVKVDSGTAVSGSLGGNPPLVASGLTVAPEQQIIITVPALVSENLTPGTVLENMVIVSSDEFGSPPPTTQSIVVDAGGFQLFIPFVIR